MISKIILNGNMTKTLPDSSSTFSELNLCFLSCSNYARGYFAGYRHISEKDLDAVIHLGDYIYEYKARDSQSS